MGIALGLGELVAGDDREAVEPTVAEGVVGGVDGVAAAAPAGVRGVGDIRVGDGQAGGGVDDLVVVGAPGGAEADRVDTGGQHDDIVGVSVVAEVGDCVDRLGGADRVAHSPQYVPQQRHADGLRAFRVPDAPSLDGHAGVGRGHGHQGNGGNPAAA